jgi:GntR family transcriptional repressor for pyruvate dehydrogenase complex
LEELRQSIVVQRSAATLGAQIAADRRFHQLLAEASGNPIFSFLLDVLAELLDTSRRRTIGTLGSERALCGHEAVLKAVAARNAEDARRAMLAHLDQAAEDLRQAAR